MHTPVGQFEMTDVTKVVEATPPYRVKEPQFDVRVLVEKDETHHPSTVVKISSSKSLIRTPRSAASSNFPAKRRPAESGFMRKYCASMVRSAQSTSANRAPECVEALQQWVIAGFPGLPCHPPGSLPGEVRVARVRRGFTVSLWKIQRRRCTPGQKKRQCDWQERFEGLLIHPASGVTVRIAPGGMLGADYRCIPGLTTNVILRQYKDHLPEAKLHTQTWLSGVALTFYRVLQ